MYLIPKEHSMFALAWIYERRRTLLMAEHVLPLPRHDNIWTPMYNSSVHASYENFSYHVELLPNYFVKGIIFVSSAASKLERSQWRQLCVSSSPTSDNARCDGRSDCNDLMVVNRRGPQFVSQTSYNLLLPKSRRIGWSPSQGDTEMP